MRLIRLLIWCFILYLIFAAADSHAAGLPDYEKVGVQVWGQPACGQPQYHWVAVDPWGHAAGRAQQSTCEMWLLTPWWATNTRVQRCETFVHEWGHLVIGDPDHLVLGKSFVLLHIEHVCARWEKQRWAKRRALQAKQRLATR